MLYLTATQNGICVLVSLQDRLLSSPSPVSIAVSNAGYLKVSSVRLTRVVRSRAGSPLGWLGQDAAHEQDPGPAEEERTCKT